MGAEAAIERLTTYSYGGVLAEEWDVLPQSVSGKNSLYIFHDTMISITRAPVMGDKTLEGTYRPHPLDANGTDQAAELGFAA